MTRLALITLALAGLLISACSRRMSPHDRIDGEPQGVRQPEVVEVITAPEGVTWEDLPPVEPGPDDWPWWRGPTLDNKAPQPQNPPVRWSKTENVLWKTAVPGRGHGSPTVWGDRVFLATADERAQVQYLLAYDRSTGQRLWQTEIHRGGFMWRNPKNSHASATPACDGRRVYIPFMVQGGIWLTAVDLQGTIVWQTKVGPFTSEHGYGASPVLYKSLLIVAGDNPGSGFLAAVHRQTGEIAWRIRRTNMGTFSSPTVGHVSGRDQLLVSGADKVSSYDPNTGKLLWYCDGPTRVTAATIAFSNELIYATGGHPAKVMLCLRADGSDDVTDTRVAWRIERDASYVPSPLLHEGLLYMVNDGGLLMCFEAETGRQLWREQLDGQFSASPVLAGGNIYVPNEDGLMYVFKPGRDFQLVATNDLGDGGFASPVICGDRIYLRTLRFLYCLGNVEKDRVVGVPQ